VADVAQGLGKQGCEQMLAWNASSIRQRHPAMRTRMASGTGRGIQQR
jgi:hypothetical protein